MNKSIETLTVEVDSYMSAFYDYEKFSAFCESCVNYGKLWSCPPFDFNPGEKLGSWKNVTLFCVRIENQEAKTVKRKILYKIKEELETMLLEFEKELNGLACGFSGFCNYCTKCSRIDNKPCCRPELVRPALEAYGIDVCGTVERLFKHKMQWDSNGGIPDEMHLVGAVFHNKSGLSLERTIHEP